MFTAIARRDAHPSIVRILKHRVGVPILVVVTILSLMLANCSRNAEVAFHGVPVCPGCVGFGAGVGLTPGSNIASFFSPLDFPNGQTEQAQRAFLQVMADQNYAVQQYVDRTGGNDDMPGTATALNFRQLLQGSGIIYFVTHGGKNDHVLVEIYQTQAVRDQMYAVY